VGRTVARTDVDFAARPGVFTGLEEHRTATLQRGSKPLRGGDSPAFSWISPELGWNALGDDAGRDGDRCFLDRGFTAAGQALANQRLAGSATSPCPTTTTDFFDGGSARLDGFDELAFGDVGAEANDHGRP